MGKPIRITDLANQMIRLSGLIPGQDIQIEYIGLRPGEKLYEELLSSKENSIPTHHPKIKIARIEVIDYEVIMPKIDYLLNSLNILSKKEVVELLKGIVPEYKSSNDQYNGKTAKKNMEIV